MIQLKCYDSPSKAEQVFVDLYEDSPIKLNLSVEDITNAEATSVFSRAFRVPNTAKNAKYFKHAFLIEGTDFDVTIKKPAEILVDGSEFRTGHIRLQKIYNNRDLDRIDYEILFLGETKDFSTVIGDASMCVLDADDLTHTFNVQNIVESWDAYPQTANLTAGLANGNVLYPLINHGNTYDEDGNVQEPEISIGDNSSNSFVHSSNALPAAQFKPMVRVKRLWDAIFEAAGYTYTSDFINPPSGDATVFSQLYASAFGNEANIGFNEAGSSLNTFSAIGNDDSFVEDYLECPVELSDLGDNYNTTNWSFTVPEDGLYTFSASAYVAAEFETQSDGFDIIFSFLSLEVNGTSVATSGNGHDQTVSLTHSITLNTNDVVRVYVDYVGGNQPSDSIVQQQTFACTQAPGDTNPIANFDCEYKQIDFIKDVLTTFRLVMAPDSNNPLNFIVEPYVSYAGAGDLHDWSDKLVLEKDLIVEPLFFTQSDRIDFKHQPDGDYINTYHLASYKETYGYLEFDSNNDLLKGTRSIKTKWAPTPMTQIEGASNTSSFILPQLHVHEAGDLGTLHLPIKCKTRFLFYNGQQSTDGGGHQHNWYLEGSAGNQSNGSWNEYPLVSYSSEWPMSGDGVVLNWNVDIGYWGNGVSGFPARTGSSLYDLYWSGYINSLYSKNARRVTGYFILNNVDLQDFSFDDIIYVNGVYYYPEKIIDAQIGEPGPVKVQLIKILGGVGIQIFPPPATETIYAILGCDGTFLNWATSAFNNIQEGTVMKIQSETGDVCVTVGQEDIPPQGTVLDTLIDGTTYLDCDACNGITPPTTYNVYTIQDCETGLYGQARSNVYSSFQIGDIVQYRIIGQLAIYCGEVINTTTSSNPTWECINNQTYGCGDTIHCAV